MDAAPKQDIDDLEQYRAEARKYLPKTNEQYKAEIDAGTDPYTSRWFGWALVAIGFATAGFIIFDLAFGGSAQC